MPAGRILCLAIAALPPPPKSFGPATRHLALETREPVDLPASQLATRLGLKP